MAFQYNGNTVNNLYYNGNTVNNLYYNGTLIWSSASLSSISATQRSLSSYQPVVGNSTSSYIIVTATYSDGTTKTVTPTSVSPSTLSSGTNTYTVSYTENGVTKSTTVSVYVGSWKVLSNEAISWYDTNYANWSYGSLTTISETFNVTGTVRAVRVTGTSWNNCFSETGYVEDYSQADILDGTKLPIYTPGMLSACLWYSASGSTLTIYAEYGYELLWSMYYYYECFDTTKIEYYS